MGCSDGEAIAAPNIAGAGGSRADHGGDAGCAVVPISQRRRRFSTGGKWRSARRGPEDFETLSLIGQGSAALVYLVKCKRTGEVSALKVQRKADHKRCADRVQMEREVMVDARHPFVAPLYHAFQDSLYLYLHMEYCTGGSLDIFVRHFVRRNLTEDEARFYAAEITLGLEFLHSKGFVYRDLKAANVLVAGSGHIKLTDFGIAERGNVKIETADKVHAESPAPESWPLPRIQSTPRLQQVSHEIPRTPPPLAAARQSLGPGISPLPSNKSTPFRPEQQRATVPRTTSAQSQRGSGTVYTGDCRTVGSRSTSPSGAARPDPVPGKPRSFRFPRRKHEAAGVLTETTPTRPSFRSKLRDRLMRSPRKRQAGRSAPHSELSSLSEVSGSARVATGKVDSFAATPGEGGRREGLALSSKSLHQKRNRPVEPTHGRSKPARGGGLPPSGLEGSWPPRVSCDRSRSPPSSSIRQATVTLDEASWCLSAGSPEYMAPEVLMHAAQGSAVDWWGLGVLTYELIMGRTPFVGKDGKTRYTYLNIMHKEAQFPEEGVESTEAERGEGVRDPSVSHVCQEFIRALLTKDPRGRAGSRGMHAVKAHPFFASVNWDQLQTQEPPLLPRHFHSEDDRHPVDCWVPVDNTSGWTWAAEDAVEEAARGEVLGTEDAAEHGAFSRFDWFGDDDDKTDASCVSGVHIRPGLGLEELDVNLRDN